MSTDMDAENYESVIVYDAASSQTPETIRASFRVGCALSTRRWTQVARILEALMCSI